jgi:precorrin-6B methylase 1
MEIEWDTGHHITFHQGDAEGLEPISKFDTAEAIVNVLGDGLSRTPSELAKELAELDIKRNTVMTTIRRMRERGELISGLGTTVRLPGAKAVEVSQPPPGQTTPGWKISN